MNKRALGCIASLLAINGCESPNAIAPPAQSQRQATGQAYSSITVDSLARAVALAFADPTVRQGVRDAMRDSPWDEHVLALSTLLESSAGARLTVAAARAVGTTPAAFRAMVLRHSGFSLWMERPFDRATWEGTSDIVVYGDTSETPSLSVPTARGYTTLGAMASVNLATYSRFPYMAVVPRRTIRNMNYSAQVDTSRRTVSTRDEERERAHERGASRLVACGPDECGGGGGGTEAGGILLPSYVNNGNCFGITAPLTQSQDPDHDGIWNQCEYDLAYAFRPMLARNNHDEAPEREPYYSVKRSPNDPSRVQILYAISYFRDPGDPSFVIEAHDGDSEFIIVTLHNTNDPRGSVWALDDETLSAHWGAGGGTEHTTTYDYNSVEFPYDFRGRPRVWVSWNKHANYRSKAVCESQWNDVCDRFYTSTAYEDLDVFANANLGNSFNTSPASMANRLLDCTSSRSPNYFGNIYQECFWSNNQYFAGWKGDAGQAKAGPYQGILLFYGF